MYLKLVDEFKKSQLRHNSSHMTYPDPQVKSQIKHTQGVAPDVHKLSNPYVPCVLMVDVLVAHTSTSHVCIF